MGRFFRALAYFFRLDFLRKSVDIEEAAKRQFTSSPEGMHAAFKLKRDALVKRHASIKEAAATVIRLSLAEQKRYEDLTEREARIKRALAGIVKEAEDAEAELAAATTDEARAQATDKRSKASAAYATYSKELEDVGAEKQKAQQAHGELEQDRETNKMALRKLEMDIDQLVRDEARTISGVTMDEDIVRMREENAGLQEGLDEGPLDAVHQYADQMHAKAILTRDLSATDAGLEEQRYVEMGKEAEGGDSLSAVLAARKKQREAQATEGANGTREKPDRPSI